MSSTLIVRDATLAINGMSAPQRDPAEHVLTRLAEARTLDRETLVDCTQVLREAAGASGGDPEVLEALIVVALAHPDLAREHELSPPQLGRRLAARLERSGDAERALAVLGILIEEFPGSEALEREMAALMRRQGMVKDLVERYMERAQALLARGRQDEAIAWYREVLLLDRSRADVARRIHDIRSRRAESRNVSRHRSRLVLASLLLSAGSVAVVHRETDLREQYHALPEITAGDVASVDRRLVQLERFVERHPVWHGAFDAMAERTRLRTVVREREIQRKQRELRSVEDAAEAPSDNERADRERERGIGAIYGSADFRAGLEHLLRAVQLADDEWEHRERTLRDIEAIEVHLKENSDQ